MRYVNPVDGGWAMPTIAPFVQLLPKGFKTAGYRATDATVFSVIEGTGRTTIGDTTFHWKPKDIFVVPSWHPVVHEADDDAVLFSYIWDVQEIVSILSHSMRIQPGDLIYTGTPAGVGPLQVGDKVTGGIDGIGDHAITIVAPQEGV